MTNLALKILTVDPLEILGIVGGLLVGIFFGAALFALIYVLSFMVSLKSKDTFTLHEAKDENTIKAINLINNAQNEFKDRTLRGKKSLTTHCTDICKNLALGIANIYHPNDRYPLFEITLSDSLDLVKYVEKRLDEILSRKVIRLIRGVKISTIFSIEQKTTKITKSKIFKKFKVANGVYKVFNSIIHIINPFWWFRKLIIDNTINSITKKLCSVSISIVGEEAYKIYSLRFIEELEIEDIAEEINNEEEANVNVVRKAKSRGFKINTEPQIATSFDNSYKLKEKKLNDGKAFKKLNQQYKLV